MNRVIIIGGGLGGLSAAVTLANAGYDVQLYEKNSHFGGKLKKITLGDATFDYGPNTITMPHVFNDVLANTGVNPSDYFTFMKLRTHTNNVFPDGTEFLFTSNRNDMVTQLERLDPKGAMHYDRYLKEIEKLYTLSEKHFLPRTFTGIKDYLSPTLSWALMNVRPFESLDHFHRRFFENEKIIQALNRYATYIGSSPYSCPATFGMIAYLELVQSVFFAKGGNTTIAEGFAKRATELGATLHVKEEVVEIITEQNKATAIKLKNKEVIEADHIILNGDLLSVYPKLIGESKRPHFTDKKISTVQPSISAFVILAALDTRLPNLIHHQVYFSNDYENEFVELFHGQYSTDPTIYVCNSSYTDPSLSPTGDNLFILVNAPALSKHRDDIDVAHYKELIYTKLEQQGLPIRKHLIHEQVVTPKDIEKDFYSFRGALYGLSANKKMDAFLRPSNRSQDLSNLYFAGGSTHPGGGSPMVVISGQNVANLLIKQTKGVQKV